MAKGYRPVNRDQPFLFPPCLRDWLPPDHPVHLVITVVAEHLDTGAFHAGRRTGGPGAAGYDPDMLLALLVWAYAHQVTSSRRIEELCRADVAFMLICGLDAPDHVTVARFRAGFADAVAGFFAEVLRLCAALGMGKLGVVALDGTKVKASAPESANKSGDTLARLAAETVARHGETDAAEDDLFGPGWRGDEVPQEAWSPRRRGERIAAALAGLEAGRQAADAGRQKAADEHLADAAAGKPRAGRRPAGADVAEAGLAVARAIAAQQAKIDDWQARDAAARAAGGKGLNRRTRPKSPASAYVRVREAEAELEAARRRQSAAAARKAPGDKDRNGPGPVRNITDPDSRLMPVRGGGFIQGYNAQNMASEDGLIIATRLTQDTGDVTWFEPMLAAAEAAAALITACRPASADSPGQDTSSPGDGAPAGYRPGGEDGYAGPIGLLLADAGYCAEDNITAPGPARLVATGKLRDLEKAARGAGDPGQPRQPHTTAMAALLRTSEGIAGYRRRGHIAETPHGNIKQNKGFRQLSVRGKPKASAEWTLACSVHNLFKAISTGHLTHAALGNLATRAGYPHSPRPVPA